LPRVFLAIDIPEDIKNLIAKDLEFLKSISSNLKASYPRVECLHITLKFIGEIEGKRVGEVIKVLRTTLRGFGSLKLGVKNRGVFPSLERPRVLWIGVDITDRLVFLRRLVEDKLHELGFPYDDKEFKPHITIARIKWIDRDGKNFIRGFVDENKEYGIFEAKKVVFYESILKPDGAIYKSIEEFTLG
jgi:2'-5' RNA ligase